MVFLATTVADAIDWISVNGDFEAVVLIQKGLNKDQDSEKQIFALQEIMGAMHSTARLLIFLTSKELVRQC
nr:hypothetical protein [uncultured bacterium]